MSFPAKPMGGQKTGLSARAVLSSIRRHLRLVSILAVVASAAGAFVGLGLPPWFQAETILIIHARPQRIAEVQELQDPVPDLPVMRSEVDVLQSRSVIEPVVRSLRLWQIPEFQPREYPAGWSWQNFEERVRDIWKIFGGADETPGKAENGGGAPPDNRNDNEDPSPAVVNETVEKYGRYLLVGTDGKSMTIRVSYRAWTPERAAMIVNAHIESYQNLQEAAKLKAAERANSALNKQIAELRDQLKTAEDAVTKYREEHHLTGAAKDSGTLSAQLAGLNSQLIQARADLAENEARAAADRGQRRCEGRGGQRARSHCIRNHHDAARPGGAADPTRGRYQQGSRRRLSGIAAGARFPAKSSRADQS